MVASKGGFPVSSLGKGFKRNRKALPLPILRCGFEHLAKGPGTNLLGRKVKRSALHDSVNPGNTDGIPQVQLGRSFGPGMLKPANLAEDRRKKLPIIGGLLEK